MLFITGPHGAGKTHSANILSNLGFITLDLGPYLRSVWLDEAPSVNFAEYLRQQVDIHGQHFTDEIITAEVNKKLVGMDDDQSTLDLLIVGNRSLTGIRYIKDHSLDIKKPQVVVYIESDENSLYRRYCVRENRAISVEEFRKLLQQDSLIGLETVKEGADFVAKNNGSIQEFESTILDIVFHKIGYKERE